MRGAQSEVDVGAAACRGTCSVMDIFAVAIVAGTLPLAQIGCVIHWLYAHVSVSGSLAAQRCALGLGAFARLMMLPRIKNFGLTSTRQVSRPGDQTKISATTTHADTHNTMHIRMCLAGGPLENTRSAEAMSSNDKSVCSGRRACGTSRIDLLWDDAAFHDVRATTLFIGAFPSTCVQLQCKKGRHAEH